MSELRFEHVTVGFGTGRQRLRAVDGVNLVVGDDMVVGLVGESGSGKSTLAKAAVGLASVDGGRILLDGTDLSRRHRYGRHAVQMVFQDPYSSLDPRMTVGATIGEGLTGVHGRRERRRRTEELLDLVGLGPEVTSRPPSALSGGQRQRVALARALAPRPSVLIADEITSALDASVQGSVLNLIRDLRAELHMSMLFISHNLAIVRYISDVIAVMYLGRCVEVAPADELVTAPQHPYTRMLLDSAPRMGTRIGVPDDGSLEQDVPDPHDPPIGCRFHPRCPIGPNTNADRTICMEQDPQLVAPGRRHQAACHFAQASPAAAVDDAVGGRA